MPRRGMIGILVKRACLYLYRCILGRLSVGFIVYGCLLSAHLAGVFTHWGGVDRRRSFCTGLGIIGGDIQSLTAFDFRFNGSQSIRAVPRPIIVGFPVLALASRTIEKLINQFGGWLN